MRFAARALPLAAAFAVAGTAPPDPLAAIAAANGHAALVHLRATASRVIEGRRRDLTVDQFGMQRLVRHCLAEVCEGTWFDGRRLWTFGINDVLLPDDDDPDLAVRRTLAAVVSYAFAESGFRAGGGSVESAGRDRWRVRALDGARLTVELDPRTHAVRRVLGDNGIVIATYGRDARTAGASFALDRTGPDEERLDEAHRETGAIQLPAGAATTYSGDGALALANEPVPIVPCTLAGRMARCLLDTGATPSAIALPLAEALHLEPRGELEIAGFSRFVTGFVETGPLAVGAATLAHVRLAVIPPVSSAHFDVAIGADLLARVHVHLDRAHRGARVGPPLASSSANAIALRFRDGIPQVAAALDGAPVTAQLDTGDASTISLGYAAYRSGPQWRVDERVQASGVAGGTDAFVVTIPNVRIGDLSFGSVRATVNRTQERTHVGIGMWSRCVVELDETNERLACASTP